jgi:hypothetical protein
VERVLEMRRNLYEKWLLSLGHVDEVMETWGGTWDWS